MGELRHLQDRHDIVLHRHLAEDARLLRQIADAGTCTFVHWIIGYLLVADIDMPFIGDDKTCGHVERSRLTGSVRTEQTDNLTLLDIERHVVGHRAASITLHKSLGVQFLTGKSLLQQFIDLLRGEIVIVVFNCFFHDVYFATKLLKKGIITLLKGKTLSIIAVFNRILGTFASI